MKEKSHAKLQNPRTTPSGRKVNTPEEKEKINVNSFNYIPPATPKGSTRTPLDVGGGAGVEDRYVHMFLQSTLS
jgi:hypothetical protein